MKSNKIADKLANSAVAAAKFVGCESASIFFSKQPKEPKSVKSLKSGK